MPYYPLNINTFIHINRIIPPVGSQYLNIITSHCKSNRYECNFKPMIRWMQKKSYTCVSEHFPMRQINTQKLKCLEKCMKSHCNLCTYFGIGCFRFHDYYCVVQAINQHFVDVYFIISPDESRGYIGFRSVAPPPPPPPPPPPL